MILVVPALVLAQVAATPMPTPTATPKPSQPNTRDAGPPTVGQSQSGLGNAAGKIKLNRAVSFEQKAIPAPAPASTPGPGPTAMPYAPATQPDCQVGAFKSALTTSMSRFADFKSLAGQTPRVSLQGPISKMVEVKQALEVESAKAPSCAQPAVKQALLYQQTVIDGFTAFLGKEEAASNGILAESELHFSRYRAEISQLP